MENLFSKFGNDAIYAFDFDFSQKLVSFAPVDNIGYDYLMRNAEHTRFMRVKDCGNSLPVALIREITPLSDDDMVFVLYDGSERDYADEQCPRIEVFRTPDGTVIPDIQCKYIIGVSRDTADRLKKTDETQIKGFTYFRGLLNDY